MIPTTLMEEKLTNPFLRCQVIYQNILIGKVLFKSNRRKRSF
jgi:hypothetical protein